MDTVVAILIGLGLAAACGFRVFVPLLVLGVAARAGHVGLAPSLEWIGTPGAIVAFATATALEVVAYKVPWMDHALDAIAAPAAVVAGALVAASQLGAVNPSGGGGHFLMWGAGIIAGGGAAGVVKATGVTTRAVSTVATAGIANPVISLFETLAAGVSSVMVIVAPVAGIVLILGIVLVLALVLLRVKRAILSARAARATRATRALGVA